MRPAVFIAGTDTGIGKTHTSCALLHALRAAGHDAVGMKPVASGCDETPEGLRNGDALALQAAGPAGVPYPLINPLSLRDPLSPHLAAAHDGVTITLSPLAQAFAILCAQHAPVVVEGVGGWRVPLAPDLLASELPRAWGLPVILVVGLRLGCLNHALLSARAITADGCELLGWIGNRIDPAMEAVEENLATLRELLPAPCLGVLPHGESPQLAARHLDAALAAMA